MVANDVNKSEMALLISQIHGPAAPSVIHHQVIINEVAGNDGAAALWREIGFRLPEAADHPERHRLPRVRTYSQKS